MTHRGPKLAAQEQARGRMEGQCPGEENSHINVTVQGAEESRDWTRLPDSVVHGKHVRASYCHGSRAAACPKVHKDTAAPNLSAHTRLFGLT